MTREEEVIQLISDIVGIAKDEIDIHSSADSIESWDSIKQIEIISALEEGYEIEIPMDQMPRMSSVQTILEILDSSCSEAER